MTRTECSTMAGSLVECARAGRQPGEVERAHLLACPACAEHMEAQVALGGQLQVLRDEVGGRRSAFARRTEILRRFDTQHPKRNLRPWWGLAVAAALLLTVGVGIGLRNQGAERDVAEELVDAQAEALEAGFIAVPFVPPLAPGELVHVVHAQLQPSALASLGLNVDPMLQADLPADVLVGADGFPRAVRISEEAVGEAGY